MDHEQRTIMLDVFRYLPEQEEQPRFQSYTVPYREDWVVLDALNHIKDQVDGTLSYRWSCRMGVCGSCGMMVNGEPKLTCAAFLKDYYPNTIRVEPLTNFPVIRDLIINLSRPHYQSGRFSSQVKRTQDVDDSQGDESGFGR